MKRKASEVSESSPSVMEEIDVMVEDVHTRAAQMDEILSQVRENCHSFISKAKQEAANIVAEAEKQTEDMKLELANWEEEKKRIASTHNFKPKVKLDVGGDTFATTLTTLTRFPDTMLGAMFSGRHALIKDEADVYFIDRDGPLFREILKFLRSPESYDNSAFQGRQLTELKNEAEYYGLKDLMFPIVPAKPVTVNNSWGRSVTITQGNDQLWYMQCSQIGTDPVVVQVCDSCGLGYPSGYSYQHGVQGFKTGRIITAAQPKKIGACQVCGAQ